eukprot:TRINITY_DN3494_c0_g1_i1.p1 TRINITY_DN3494_c0_g1~~TRINITY_DN3494_c0_g1_i1.p1  ORF type:complete len:216 (+),score=68.87 TRINITY_DN3494_c0_g1_i1:61-708(+)
MTTRVVGLLVLAAAARAGSPWFCHGLDCPVYTQGKNLTTASGDPIEVRRYAAGQQWTSTLVKNVQITEAGKEGFHKLFDYISGDNAQKAAVPMTAPVRTYVQPAQGPFCATNFTVSFYVPFAYQPALNASAAVVPAPAAADVATTTDAKAVTVAVRSFAGFADDANTVQEAAGLAEALVGAGVKFDEANWYFAAYDSPYRLKGRHNEVWIQLYDY